MSIYTVEGPAPRDPGQPFWDADIQTMPREQLRALQETRFKEMISRIFNTPVPFYVRKLQAAGITSPSDIRGLDDLADLPTTSKQDLRDAEAAYPPFGDYRFFDPRLGIRIGTSTGTTGTPTLMVWTRRDVLVECECQSRCMWRGGQRPGAVVAHAHPAYLYPGALMMQTYFEYFGILGISLPPPDSDETLGRSVEFLKRFKPDRSAMAFSHSRFVEYAARHGLDAREDLGLVETRVTPSPSSGIPLASAGLECFGPLGSACSNQRGAHIAEDHAVVEALDPTTGRSVPDGEWGNLVVTTFGRDSCHLRYDLQEAVRIERTECGCGETSIRAWWGGRFKDIVSTQGSSFTFLDVNAVLSDPAIALDTPTAEYVVVRPASSDAPVALYLESRDPANTTLNDRVATSLNERLGVKFEVTLIPEQTLARAEYKQERLVDRPPSVG